MKKYMFVIPTLTIGGAERVVSVLANAIAKCGQSVSIAKYYSAENEYPAGNLVTQINMFGEGRDTYETMSYCKKVVKLRKTIKNYQPDYVIPFMFQVAQCADLAVTGLNTTVCQSMRIDPATSPKSRIQRFLRDRLVYKSKCTFVQNEKQRQYFKADSREKIHVLYNPVSDELFDIIPRFCNEKYTICSAGRLEKQKNFKLLIDAFEEAFSKNENVILQIYGEGSQKDSLRDHIATKNSAHRICLMGRSNDMIHVYEHSDLFVLSSDFEGMPNALIEAMACGLPCISTDCPTGPAYLIENEKNGILVPVGDVKRMAKAMREMFQSQEVASRMGKNARGTIMKKCKAENIAQQMIQICESIK